MRFLNIYLLGIFIGLTGCKNISSSVVDSVFFGGEIINPKGDEVIFYSRDGKISDTLKLDNNNRFQKKFASIETGVYYFRHGSEIQLMTAKTNADAMASQLRAAMEQLGMVKDQLAFTSIYSDVDGVAEEVNVKVGELFMGPGQIKIVNTTKLKLTAEVPENYAGKVKVGTELTLTFPDIQKTISNKVNVLGNVIDPLNRSFYIESKLPVDNNFRPNLLAQVKIKD